MEKLPNGVTIRDFYSPREVRDLIFSRVQKGFEGRFPMENDSIRIDLDSIGYDEKKKRVSLEDYQKAVLTGGRLSVPLRGKVRLTDKKLGVKLDEKEIVLANVPYMTDDGTFVMGGTHYSVVNQSRLKPGVYARTKDNGELESHINVLAGTGPSMRVFMEPETGVFRASIDKSNMKLYPILKGMGITDDQLRQSWGEDILEQNKKAFDSRAFGKFYNKLLRKKAVIDATDDDMRSSILERLQSSRLDPEVTMRTSGKPYESLSMDTLIDASRKLLAVNRGESDEDDRDHPANRSFHSVEDFMEERVAKDAGKLGRNLLYKATYDRSLKQLRPGYFTPQLEGLIVGNQLSQVVSGLNPVELYDQHKRVIQIGDGGISSMDAIPMSSRNLHAGQFGMIDPIRSSESRSIGVDQRFTASAKKGDDGHVYFPWRNRKTGKTEYLNSVQLYNKTVAFPKPPTLEKFRTVAAPVPVTPLPVNKDLPQPPGLPAPGSMRPDSSAADLLTL